MLSNIIAQMAQKDLVQGDWSIDGRKVTVWIDVSSLATGVVVESGESLIEDAYWLQPASEDKHINLAELDAKLRGINLALQWVPHDLKERKRRSHHQIVNQKQD